MAKETYQRVSSLSNLPDLLTFRKGLRGHLTPAEARLWSCLKEKQLDGRKFRRQHGFGGYILDFYCPAERLAVELDGAGHGRYASQVYDRERDLFLARFKVLVLRFENKRVFENPQGVLDCIRGHFGWRGA